jgi:hypothetical protein
VDRASQSEQLIRMLVGAHALRVCRKKDLHKVLFARAYTLAECSLKKIADNLNHTGKDHKLVLTSHENTPDEGLKSGEKWINESNSNASDGKCELT